MVHHRSFNANESTVAEKSAVLMYRICGTHVCRAVAKGISSSLWCKFPSPPPFILITIIRLLLSDGAILNVDYLKLWVLYADYQTLTLRHTVHLQSHVIIENNRIKEINFQQMKSRCDYKCWFGTPRIFLSNRTFASNQECWTPCVCAPESGSTKLVWWLTVL